MATENNSASLNETAVDGNGAAAVAEEITDKLIDNERRKTQARSNNRALCGVALAYIAVCGITYGAVKFIWK